MDRVSSVLKRHMLLGSFGPPQPPLQLQKQQPSPPSYGHGGSGASAGSPPSSGGDGDAFGSLGFLLAGPASPMLGFCITAAAAASFWRRRGPTAVLPHPAVLASPSKRAFLPLRAPGRGSRAAIVRCSGPAEPRVPDNHADHEAVPQKAQSRRAKWTIPEDYNWEVCTQENYAAPKSSTNRLNGLRDLTDKAYHGSYSREREAFQDELLLEVLRHGRGYSRERPMLMFTAGAMGVGKSYVLDWMQKHGTIDLNEFVVIDPDSIAQMLPEWSGYKEADPSSAALKTRLEAGLLTELSLVLALQHRKNILVDSSLRHGGWYSRVLDRIRRLVPDVYIVLLYIHSREDIIQQRAATRASKAGRATDVMEVDDSMKKMPRAVGRLLRHVDFFAQVANNECGPCVTAYSGMLPEEDACGTMCSFTTLESNTLVECIDVGWQELEKVLSKAKGGVPAEPLKQPPAVLPTSSAKESQPLRHLLRTMELSARKHKGQTRKDPQRTPYINHPLAVARILAEAGIRDIATLQAALLHDTLEDTDTTSPELRAAFGDEVIELVESLTDDDSLNPRARKLVQLRGAKALRYKAKLVRIADKLHNVWDIKTHGIRGWTKERKDQYVAWACELINKITGTHEDLEKRFHEEVSLPPGYAMGDWEDAAVAKIKSRGQDWVVEGYPTTAPESDSTSMSEHKAVLSLLLAAEWRASLDHKLNRGEQIGVGVGTALVLASRSVRDLETLQAALLYAGGPLTPQELSVHRKLGNEVARITSALADLSLSSGEEDGRLGLSIDTDSGRLRQLPYKAKLVLLARVFESLREMQLGGLESEGLKVFRDYMEKAIEIRQALRGTHENLEAGLDEIFNGQVRLVPSGQLVPSACVLEYERLEPVAS